MRSRNAPSRGMTLIVVLWTVAALTILVTGLVRSQRSELRLAQTARLQVRAQALGQAALAQTLQRMAASPAPTAGDARLQRWRERAGDVEVEVEALPLSGLVDLNLAPEALLAGLFAGPGGQAIESAQALAAQVVAVRQAPGPGGARQRFETADELLAVPGADPDLFARIAPLVTTDSAGSGKVNALAAPPDLLVVLARGDLDTARRIAAERDAGSPAIDTTRLEAAHTDATVSHRYRFTAFVPDPDGLRAFAVVRDIDIRAARPGGAPWQTLRASIRRVPDLTARHGGG